MCLSCRTSARLTLILTLTTIQDSNPETDVRVRNDYLTLTLSLTLMSDTALSLSHGVQLQPPNGYDDFTRSYPLSFSNSIFQYILFSTTPVYLTLTLTLTLTLSLTVALTITLTCLTPTLTYLAPCVSDTQLLLDDWAEKPPIRSASSLPAVSVENSYLTTHKQCNRQ